MQILPTLIINNWRQDHPCHALWIFPPGKNYTEDTTGRHLMRDDHAFIGRDGRPSFLDGLIFFQHRFSFCPRRVSVSLFFSLGCFREYNKQRMRESSKPNDNFAKKTNKNKSLLYRKLHFRYIK